VTFRLTPDLAPGRVVAVGAAYDNDLGGRIWLGQVNRHVLRTNLEISSTTFLGELRQELFAGARLTSPRGASLAPALELRASRELVRRFNDGDETSPQKVHKGTAFAALHLSGMGNWHAALGVEGRLWDAPGRQGQSSLGPRLAVLKAGRMAEPLFRLDAVANSVFQRVEAEGIATVRLGRLQVRPHLRYGWGNSLPLQQQFVFGGVDGFAGRHIGELRSEREIFGSLVILHPIKGRLMLRVEPMVGVSGGGEGLFPEGDAVAGGRMGLNLFTGLGPIRVEYGFSEGSRDGLLVRLGRWF
jgi:hypothetical protein